ncbi:hypothetical protein EGW08_016460 [Elysia chlorotica]|uniref:G-protein coupled receptors family 1 profile domain-containing protein n=1 Tax=Elysia chlorotica TaxID=188477 RepID=A0A433T2F9_ELYCH|nr:hypothetical protein EGW08_016460 [Elysia chlorotica]
MNNTTDGGSNASLVNTSEYRHALQAIYISHCVFVVIGTLLNLWLFFCIVTSKDLRERFRNQLICNMAVLHLTESLIKSPIIVAFILKVLSGNTIEEPCHFIAAINNTERIQSFIVDWLLVFLVALFLAQVLGCSPPNKLTPLSLRIGKVLLHVLPWAAALVVTPSLVYFYQGENACLSPPYLSHFVFTSINTVTPVILSMVLAILATALSCWRRQSWASRMGANLINGPRDVDSCFAYIAAVVTTAACEICNVAFYMYLKINMRFLGIGFEAAALILSDSRVIFMVLPWLLLSDVRCRLKTWRPWYRPPPGIDLTVTYDKETCDQHSVFA